MRAERLIVVTLGLGLVAAGCASAPDTRPDGPAGKVAVTPTQAADVLERHDEIRSAADAERDAEAVETIETGPVLEASLTQYRLAEANDEEAPERLASDDVRAYSPRFTEYPMWFVATAEEDDQVAVRVLTRSSPSDEWVTEQTANLGGVSLPRVEADGGAVQEATDDQVSRVDAVLEEVYRYLSGQDGEADEGSPAATEVEVNLDQVGGLESYRTWTAESAIALEEVTDPEISCRTDERAEVRVLPTGGGVLGVATGTCRLRQALQEDIEGEMTLGGELSALAPDAGREVTFVSSHPLVVSVPDDGPVQVFSGGWRWAEVTMS